MEQARADNVIVMSQQRNDWSKLIRKLRWIGMEEEAQRLQLAMCSLPSEEALCRSSPSAPPQREEVKC